MWTAQVSLSRVHCCEFEETCGRAGVIGQEAEEGAAAVLGTSTARASRFPVRGYWPSVGPDKQGHRTPKTGGKGDRFGRGHNGP